MIIRNLVRDDGTRRQKARPTGLTSLHQFPATWIAVDIVIRPSLRGVAIFTRPFKITGPLEAGPFMGKWSVQTSTPRKFGNTWGFVLLSS